MLSMKIPKISFRDLISGLLIAVAVLCYGTTLAQASDTQDVTILKQQADQLMQQAMEKYHRILEKQSSPELQAQFEQLQQVLQNSTYVSDLSAEEVRAVTIANWMYNSLPPRNEDGWGFEMSDEYQVETTSKGINVTVDTLNFHINNGSIEMGPWILTVQPKSTNEFSYTLQMPDKMEARYTDHVDQENSVVEYLNIGDQDARGIWNENLKLFTRFSTRLSDLTIKTERKGSVDANLDGMSWNGRIDHAPGNTWRAQYRFDARGFNVTNKGGDQPIEIKVDSVHGSSQGMGVQIQRIAELQQEVAPLLYAAYFNNDLEKIDRVKAASLFSNLFRLVGSYGWETETNGLHITGVSLTPINIGRIAEGGSLDNTHQSGSKFVYWLELNDPSFGENSIMPNDLSPTGVRMEFTFERLPKDLWLNLMDLVVNSEQSPPDPAAKELMMQFLLQQIMENQSSFTMRHTYLTFPNASIRLDSSIQADPKAVFQSTGTLSLMVENLPILFEHAGAMFDDDKDMKIGLAMIQAFSERTEENGKTIDRFDIVLDNQGQIMVNGKDMSVMFD